jgi:hypothetical protein
VGCRNPHVLQADWKCLHPARNLIQKLLHLGACQPVARPGVTDTYPSFDQQTSNRLSTTFSGENEDALGPSSIDPGGQCIMDLQLGPGRALHVLAPTGLNGSIQPGAIGLGQPIAEHNQAPEHAA